MQAFFVPLPPSVSFAFHLDDPALLEARESLGVVAPPVPEGALVGGDAVDHHMGYVRMPAPVRGIGLAEACPLAATPGAARTHHPGPPQDRVGRGRTGNCDIRVHHHVGASPVAVEGMLPVEVGHGLDLIARKAILAGNERSVRIGNAGARTPDGKLAGPYAKPAAEIPCGNAGSGCPEVDEPHDFLTPPEVHPCPGQFAPGFF